MAYQTETDYPRIKELSEQIADCIRAAREQGWQGADAEYELTPADIESIEDVLGYRPDASDYQDARRFL